MPGSSDTLVWVLVYICSHVQEEGFFNGKSPENLKKLKTHPRRLFMPTSTHTYQKYLNRTGDPFLLRDNLICHMMKPYFVLQEGRH
jgi:hypothetical protein